MSPLTRRSALCILLCLAGTRPASAAADRPAGKTLRHYVFFGRDRERISEPSFLETKAFEGAQVKYTWRQLERVRGEYDFSEIEHDLALLSSRGKRLFIQVQDVSFDESIVPLPRYLLEDPAYHGGADRQYTVTGDDEQHATPAGWVARRWDPAVQGRFHELLVALGTRFDGRIEGINLAETAIDFGESGRLYPRGFTPDVYRDAVIGNMRVLKRAFPRSVAMLYANFMFGRQPGAEPGSHLQDLYREAKGLKVAMGGPDLKPYRPGQMSNSYPLLRDIADSVPTGIAVQDGNYDLPHPKTGKPVTLEELVAFAKDYLNVDYVFWCTEEPFYSRDLIPYLRRPK